MFSNVKSPRKKMKYSRKRNLSNSEDAIDYYERLMSSNDTADNRYSLFKGPSPAVSPCQPLKLKDDCSSENESNKNRDGESSFTDNEDVESDSDESNGFNTEEEDRKDNFLDGHVNTLVKKLDLLHKLRRIHQSFWINVEIARIECDLRRREIIH